MAGFPLTNRFVLTNMFEIGEKWDEIGEIYNKLNESRLTAFREAKGDTTIVLLSQYTFLIGCCNALLKKLAKPNKIKSMDDLRNKFPDVYQLVLDIKETLPSETQSKLTAQLQEHFR